MELWVGFEYHYHHVFIMQFEQNSRKVQMCLQAMKNTLTRINKLFYTNERHDIHLYTGYKIYKTYIYLLHLPVFPIQ